MMPRKCVAFEGAKTGRRFYGCPVQVSINTDDLVHCSLRSYEATD
jgi:hypothetical protein